MGWAAVIGALIKWLSAAAPVIAIWLANRAGKQAGKAEAEAEQTAANAQAQEKYSEIEMEDRSEGDWLK